MTFAVSKRGITVPTGIAGAVVVELEGSYLWSFTPERDGRRMRGGYLVPWPEALHRYLRGRGRVRLTDPGSDTVWFDGVVNASLGPARGRHFRVQDDAGNPLCIDKVGHLTRSFEATDESSKTEVLEVTQRVLRDLVDHAGVEAYLCYGALLGAVRDGGMVSYDSDTDVCYLSAFTEPADIIRESYAVERAMTARGWQLIRMSGADVKVLHHLADGREVQVDIFGAFYVEGTFYQLGNRNGPLDRSVISPTRSMDIAGYEMPVPAKPEAMLEFLYGAGWRVPDPSFKYADNPVGVRRLDGWLRGYRDEMTLWAEFWGHDASLVPTRPSSFLAWAAESVKVGERVADIGAGNGRDAFGWAALGSPAFALEARNGSIAVMQRRIAESGEANVFPGYLNLGEFRTVAAWGVRFARAPHHVYVRDLLGRLTPEAEADLWRLARMATRRGSRSLFLEFPAIAARAPEPAGVGRRVRLDPDVVRARIEVEGGTVVREFLGAGEDFLGQPDPAVCRFEVVWTKEAQR